MPIAYVGSTGVRSKTVVNQTPAVAVVAVLTATLITRALDTDVYWTGCVSVMSKVALNEGLSMHGNT